MIDNYKSKITTLICVMLVTIVFVFIGNVLLLHHFGYSGLWVIPIALMTLELKNNRKTFRILPGIIQRQIGRLTVVTAIIGFFLNFTN